MFLISVKASQPRRDEEEKETSYQDLQVLADTAAPKELLVVLGDLNAHTGRNKRGYEMCLEKCSLGTMNDEGKTLRIAKQLDSKRGCVSWLCTSVVDTKAI